MVTANSLSERILIPIHLSCPGAAGGVQDKRVLRAGSNYDLAVAHGDPDEIDEAAFELSASFEKQNETSMKKAEGGDSPTPSIISA